jgi:hypothetical protein
MLAKITIVVSGVHDVFALNETSGGLMKYEIPAWIQDDLFPAKLFNALTFGFPARNEEIRRMKARREALQKAAWLSVFDETLANAKRHAAEQKAKRRPI